MINIANLLGIGKTISETATAATEGAAKIVTAAKTDPNIEYTTQLEKLRLETEGKIEQLVQQSVNEARDFAIQYEGKASEIQPWLRIVRNLIRPSYSVFFLVLTMAIIGIDLVNYIRGVGEPWALTAGIPTAIWTLEGIVLAFWFGGKVGERIVEKVKEE